MDFKNLFGRTAEKSVPSSALRPYLIPVFSDTHPNSTVGLCPPGGIQLDDGGRYHPSRTQLAIWDGYLRYWDRVASLKRELGAHCIAMFTGDGTDDNKHSKYQLATVNEAVAVKTGVAVLRPMLDVADEHGICRGTESHTGGSGHLEELIAQEAGAMQTDEMREQNVWSRWFWELEDLHGLDGLFSHHPFSSSRVPWTAGGGVSRTARAIEWEYGVKAKRRIPAFACFGHVHNFDDSGAAGECRVFQNYGWSIPTAFVHRIGRGWTFTEVGAFYIIVYPDGRWEWNRMSFVPTRAEPWRASVL